MSESAPPPPPPGDSSGNQGANPPGDQGPGSAPPPPPPASGYSAAPPPAQQSVGPQGGGVLDRFLARLIDFIILGIVNFIIVSLIIVGIIFGSGDRGSAFTNTGGSYAASAVSGVLGAIIYLAYFAFMESSRGQTIGKMAMKLHVEGPSGGNPTMNEAVKRNLWVALGALAIIPVVGSAIGGLVELVIMIVIAVQIGNSAPDRQSFMDRFAGGTKVVKRP